MTDHAMRCVALTGGIATGKSAAADLFCELLPSTVRFDCDASVGRWLRDSEVVAHLHEGWGVPLGAEGQLVRAELREQAFGSTQKRRELEGLLHPRVRKECLELLEQTREKGLSPLFLVEVPLLFENGGDFGQQESFVVATTSRTQRHRLRKRSALSEEMIDAILRAQWPLPRKMQCADVLFWNEGPPFILRQQIRRYLHFHALL